MVLLFSTVHMIVALFCDPSYGWLIHPPSFGDTRSRRPGGTSLAMPPLKDSDDSDDEHIYYKNGVWPLFSCCSAMLNALSYSQQRSSGPRDNTSLPIAPQTIGSMTMMRTIMGMTMIMMLMMVMNSDDSDLR